MARIPCDSAIPAWSSLYSTQDDLAREIAEIIWGTSYPLLFDDDTELLWDDGSTILLW